MDVLLHSLGLLPPFRTLVWTGVLILAVAGLCPSSAEAQTGRQLVDFALRYDSVVAEEAPQAIDTQGIYVQQYQVELDEMQAELPPAWGTWNRRQRAEWVLEQVHQRFLTGSYRESLHSLAVTLDTGEFNCLTASILFQATAEEFGLPVTAIQTRGHVWCRLWDGEAVDIETTSPRLSPPSPLVQPTSAGDSLTFRPVAEQQVGPPEVPIQLTAAALVAKLPYNAASLASQRRDFSAAADLLTVAQALDPADPAIRNNLAAVLNNWALEAADRRDWEETAQVRRRLEGVAPTISAELPSLETIDQAILTDLRTGRNYAAARAHLRRVEGGLDSDSAQILAEVYRDWISHALRQQNDAEAQNAYRQAQRDLADHPGAAAWLRLEFPELRS